MSYHVGVSNIFELLGDENEEASSKPTEASSKSKAKAPTQSQGSVKPKQPVTKNEKPNETKAKSDAKGDKGAKKPTRGGDSGGVSRVEGEETDKRKQQPKSGERTGERRKESSASGSSGGSGAPRGNKRVHERKSGTGRGKEMKKGGSGKGNWGTSEDDQKVQSDVAQEQEEDRSQAKEKEEPKAEGEAKSDAAKTEPVAETEEERKKREEREKEEKQIDFEEYKKRLSEKAPKVSLPETRRANEGTKEKWSEYVPIQRDDADAVPLNKQKAKKSKEVKKSDQVPVDQVFKVQEEKRARGFGQRNNSNNGGGRANPKNYPKGKRGASGSAAPTLDASSFPALTTKP